jgi:hypothetical protein
MVWCRRYISVRETTIEHDDVLSVEGSRRVAGG